MRDYCFKNKCRYIDQCIQDGVNCQEVEINYLDLCEILPKIEDKRYMRIRQMMLDIEIKGEILNGNTS